MNVKEKLPLVSICIPTYNRKDYLKACIESLLDQEAFKKEHVEIVISDNASTDGTEDMCRQYAGKYCNLIYHRQENPIDWHINFLTVLKYGTGILRKLSNDTLIYTKDSLGIICTIAEKYQDDAPAVYFSNSLPKIPFNKDCMVETDEFIRYLGYNITSISGFAIWGRDCDDRLPEKVINPNLWQVDEIFTELGCKKQGVLCNQHIFNTQNIICKDLSYGLFDTFYIHFFDILNKYSRALNITDEDKKLLKKDILLNFFTHWMLCCAVKDYRYIFSTKEKLEERIYEVYREEEYFSKYITDYERIRKELMFRYQELKSFIQSHNRIYLYGTGHVASILQGYCMSLNKGISGAIVTKKNGAKLFYGKEVFEVSDFFLDRRNDGILIATGIELQKEIVEMLSRMGWEENLMVQQVFSMKDKYLIRI